ncbi:hypothetical protein [Aeromicrobium sp.]|uniref:hypothetical protein n=1 Tax=Aeromicrobium sp. TaxID=1871063 RepID=UPI0030BDCAB9
MKFRLRLLALFIASAFALAGCGDGSDQDDVSNLSTSKLLAAAKKQLATQEYVSVEGKGTDKDDDTSLEIDLDFAGDTASGTITVNGMEIELLKADGQAYFKAGKEFFGPSESAAETMDLIGDRWVLADPDDPTFGEIASFVSKKDFFAQLLDPDGKVTKVDEKSVNGVDSVGLKSTDSTFYFDKSDAKPVSLVTTDDGSGTLDFTYDKMDAAEAPPADEIVDPAKLGR